MQYSPIAMECCACIECSRCAAAGRHGLQSCTRPTSVALGMQLASLDTAAPPCRVKTHTSIAGQIAALGVVSQFQYSRVTG